MSIISYVQFQGIGFKLKTFSYAVSPLGESSRFESFFDGYLSHLAN